MELRVFENYEELSDASAAHIAAQVRQKPESLLCLPSGDTPTGTLRRLASMVRTGEVDFSRCMFVGLDEWVGMDRKDEGSCQHYLYTNFFEPAAIQPRQIVFFDARSSNLENECARINRFLDENGPIDLALLGVGVNGHIGLNEPGIDPSSNAHVVTLEASTKRVAQKYFTSGKTLDRGISLGLAQLMDARTVMLIASGGTKSRVIQQVAEGPVTNEIPATHLRNHRNCLVLVDRAAAALAAVS